MSAIACSVSLCMSILTCLCVYVCVFLSCTVAFQQLSYFQTKDKTVYRITFDFPSPLLQLSYQIHPQIQTPTQACFFLSWWGLSLDCWATDIFYSKSPCLTLTETFLDFYFSLRHYLVCYLTHHFLVSTMISSCYYPYEYIWFPQHRQNVTHTFIIGPHRSHGYFVRD